MVKVGDVVTYVDQRGEELPALVQAVHGTVGDEKPSINVVFVSRDEKRIDSYGRQVEHETSIVHESHQSANGFYWKPRA